MQGYLVENCGLFQLTIFKKSLFIGWRRRGWTLTVMGLAGVPEEGWDGFPGKIMRASLK